MVYLEVGVINILEDIIRLPVITYDDRSFLDPFFNDRYQSCTVSFLDRNHEALPRVFLDAPEYPRSFFSFLGGISVYRICSRRFASVNKCKVIALCRSMTFCHTQFLRATIQPGTGSYFIRPF